MPDTPAMPNRKPRARELGVRIGVLPTGPGNALTDVAGVTVGHVTLIEDASVRTGVTAIRPHPGDVFREKVPAAIFCANSFGKLAGGTQVQELGQLETPIVLTNTLSVAAGIDALITHTLNQPGNADVRSINALVGETNDGQLNDITARHVTTEHVLQAISNATDGPVPEGNVGAGSGTVCFGHKGGIGTASRKLPDHLGGYTLGVLAQANFDGLLQIDGVRVGEALGRQPFASRGANVEPTGDADGSCMIVVATDAPLDARRLKRLAKRAFMGLARTGGFASHGSGEYVVAFSTAHRIAHNPTNFTQTTALLHDQHMTPLFAAAIESTEEAIVNALFAAERMTGRYGRVVEALPTKKVLDLLRQAGRLDTASSIAI